MNDLRFACRQLLKNPGSTAVVVLTLALGVGMSTVIFSGVNALWFNPVPAAEPDRLVEIQAFHKEQNRYLPTVSPVIIQEMRAKREMFDRLTVMAHGWFEAWEEAEGVEDIVGTGVSPNFFTIWNVKPLLGRTFAADEGRPGSAPVIVLGHAFWKNQLGGDPAWEGKTIRLGNRDLTVIGVMPPHFKFPFFCQFWVPIEDPRVLAKDTDGDSSPFRTHFGIIARLAPGVSLQQAQAMLEVVSRQYEAEHRKAGFGYTSLHWRPLRQEFTSEEMQRTIPGFLGAMIFVLLIACANVANLNLARTEGRQRELAIRSALGAGRLQLLRQLLVESLLPALVGAVAGVVLTYWSFGLMERVLPWYVLRVRTIEADPQVLGYSLLTAIAAGLLSGIVPAWHGARRPVAEALKQGGFQATHGVLRNFYRRGLVVFEVALATLLLAGAGLMIQSVVRLLRSKPGYDPTNLLCLRITPGIKGGEEYKKYDTLEAKNLLLAEVHRRLSAVPGVEAVGIRSPTWESGKFVATGQTEPVKLYVGASGVGPADAFKAMRVPLLRGRYLDERDLSANATAVLVNETLARRCWPGQDPVGQTIRSTAKNDSSIYEVVGLVADTRIYALTEKLHPVFFRPPQRFARERIIEFYVRTRIKPEGLVKPLLREVKTAAPDLGKPQVARIKEGLYDSTRAHRTYTYYLGVFGAVGLLLASAGLFAVLAYSVATRQREIGIRMALGATRRQVLRLVLRQGMTLVGIGVVLGLGAACALTRLLRGMLYGVSPLDPLSLAAGALLLSLIAFGACYFPACRAAKVDPSVALRCE